MIGTSCAANKKVSLIFSLIDLILDGFTGDGIKL